MIKSFFFNIYSYIRLIILGAKSQYKSLLGMILSSLIAPALISAVFIAISPILNGIFAQQKLVLVFCDLEGSAYFDTVLNLLLADESVTKTVTVKKLNYNESLAELDSGRADAVIIFPESFISDMSRGINRPIKILGSEADPVRTVFIKEFMQSAADELSAAQSAINTVWFSMDLESMGDTRRAIIFSSLVLEYTSKAFARSIYYNFNNVDPPFEGYSQVAFLTASVLAAIVFFGALPGIKQIQFERKNGIATRLAASGASCAGVAFYHYFPILIKQLLCACFAVLIALPAVTIAVKASAPDSVAEVAATTDAAVDADDMAGSSANGANAIIGGVIDSTLGARKNVNTDDVDLPESSGGAEADSAGVSDETGVGGAGAGGAGSIDGSGGGGSPEKEGNNVFSIADIPNILKLTATSENAMKFLRTLIVMCVLAMFTSSIALFIGYMIKRSEAADILIVTCGIIMAVAGGTVIPYAYLPDIFKPMGPFSYNMWAQKMIASSLFTNNAAGIAGSAESFGSVGSIGSIGSIGSAGATGMAGGLVDAGSATILAGFAITALLFIIATTIKIKFDRIKRI